MQNRVPLISNEASTRPATRFLGLNTFELVLSLVPRDRSVCVLLPGVRHDMVTVQIRRCTSWGAR
jgi:hypothetical protein